jgi:hypothetical protein
VVEEEKEEAKTQNNNKKGIVTREVSNEKGLDTNNSISLQHIDRYVHVSICKVYGRETKNSLTNNYQLKLDQMISSRLLSIFRMSCDEKQQQQQSPIPFQQHAKKRTNPSLRETVARKIVSRERDRSGPLVWLLLRLVPSTARERERERREERSSLARLLSYVVVLYGRV